MLYDITSRVSFVNVVGWMENVAVSSHCTVSVVSMVSITMHRMWRPFVIGWSPLHSTVTITCSPDGDHQWTHGAWRLIQQ